MSEKKKRTILIVSCCALFIIVIIIVAVCIANSALKTASGSTQTSSASSTSAEETSTGASEEKEEQVFKQSCQSYSYDDLKSQSDDYEGKNIKITGTVFAVSGDTFRVTTGGDNGDVYYVDASASTARKAAQDIESDDKVIVYGHCDGIYSAQSIVMGSKVSMPKITAVYLN